MGRYKFSNKSLRKLIGVNPVLSYITIKAIKRSKYDYSVFEGVRSIQRQKYLVSIGRSWTYNSKHLSGNAVDLVPYINGKLTWDGKNADIVFKEIYNCMKIEASKIGVKLICGYDWENTDKPHFQLSTEDINGYDIRNIQMR